MLILRAASAVTGTSSAAKLLIRKIVRALEKTDDSPRAIFPAQTIAAIHDRWAADRAILARDHGLVIPDPKPAAPGPEHVAISQDRATRVRDALMPRLDPDAQRLLERALKMAGRAMKTLTAFVRRPRQGNLKETRPCRLKIRKLTPSC